MASEDKNRTPDIEEELALPQPMARQATLFSPRVKLGAVFVLIAGALVYFAFTAFGGATVEFR